MAAYSYKEVVYRDDFQELIPEFEKQFRRECDQNSNYDGDYWLIAEMLLTKKDETIRAQQATIDRLTEQRDRLLKVSTEYRQINQCGSPSCQINVVSSCKCTNCVSDRLEELIAEIEGHNKYARDE